MLLAKTTPRISVAQLHTRFCLLTWSLTGHSWSVVTFQPMWSFKDPSCFPLMAPTSSRTRSPIHHPEDGKREWKLVGRLHELGQKRAYHFCPCAIGRTQSHDYYEWERYGNSLHILAKDYRHRLALFSGLSTLPFEHNMSIHSLLPKHKIVFW